MGTLELILVLPRNRAIDKPPQALAVARVRVTDQYLEVESATVYQPAVPALGAITLPKLKFRRSDGRRFPYARFSWVLARGWQDKLRDYEILQAGWLEG